MAEGTTPLAQAYRAYEQFEGQLSAALDQLVATNGFADLLATSATNVMALTRVVNGAVDRLVRSTRLAARQDVTDLARQLARTEDKLERLLQAVRQLQDDLDAGRGAEAGTAGATGTAPSADPAAAARPRPTAAAARTRRRAAVNAHPPERGTS